MFLLTDSFPHYVIKFTCRDRIQNDRRSSGQKQAMFVERQELKEGRHRTGRAAAAAVTERHYFRAGRAAAIGSPLLGEKILGNNIALDLVGAFDDLQPLRLPHEAFHGVIGAVALGAENLKGVQRDLHSGVRGKGLGYAD